MSAIFHATVALPPAELSPNGRVHWGMKSRITKKYREGCAWAYVAARPRTWVVPMQVVVDLEYRAHRGCGGYHPKDRDNAIAACKAILDALKDARVIGSDAKDRLELGVFKLMTTAREVIRAGGPGVTVIVRARP